MFVVCIFDRFTHEMEEKLVQRNCLKKKGAGRSAVNWHNL
jgi:hypothetical protein